MKTRILKVLKDKGYINITDITDLIPETKGTKKYYMPVKKGMNKRLLIVMNVTSEFIVSLNTLIRNRFRNNLNIIIR